MAFTYRRIKGQLPHAYERQLESLRPKQDISFMRISLSKSGVLTIGAGYVWDFAYGAFDTKTIIEGSLVHDALCELIHNDLLSYHQWKNAAEEMRAVCVEAGMWKLRAAYVARAIKIAGPSVTVARTYVTV